VGELAGGFEPVDDVEVEVVPAGAAVEDEGCDSDEGGQGDEDQGPAVSRHGFRVSRQWVKGVEEGDADPSTARLCRFAQDDTFCGRLGLKCSAYSDQVFRLPGV
jgi:hypothetical protein